MMFTFLLYSESHSHTTDAEIGGTKALCLAKSTVYVISTFSPRNAGAFSWQNPLSSTAQTQLSLKGQLLF